MSKVLLILLFIPFQSSAKNIGKVSSNPQFIIYGRVQQNKKPDTYTVETATVIYELDRQSTFLANQIRLKKQIPQAQLDIKVKPSYIKNVRKLALVKKGSR